MLRASFFLFGVCGGCEPIAVAARLAISTLRGGTFETKAGEKIENNGRPQDLGEFCFNVVGAFQ